MLANLSSLIETFMLKHLHIYESVRFELENINLNMYVAISVAKLPVVVLTSNMEFGIS